MSGGRGNAAKKKFLRSAIAAVVVPGGRVLAHDKIVFEDFAGIFARLDFGVVPVFGQRPVRRPPESAWH